VNPLRTSDSKNTVRHLHHLQELIPGKLLAGCHWKLQQHRRMFYGGLFCSLKTHSSVKGAGRGKATKSIHISVDVTEFIQEGLESEAKYM
jgi:hypothetical protein